jgi:hypothetical protein
VYSLNSESCIVKNGLKSDPYLSGSIRLTSDWTVSEQTSGVGAITVIGSHVSISSQRSWIWDITALNDL